VLGPTRGEVLEAVGVGDEVRRRGFAVALRASPYYVVLRNRA
jgi:hypothetical protein